MDDCETNFSDDDDDSHNDELSEGGDDVDGYEDNGGGGEYKEHDKLTEEDTLSETDVLSHIPVTALPFDLPSEYQIFTRSMYTGPPPIISAPFIFQCRSARITDRSPRQPEEFGDGCKNSTYVNMEARREQEEKKRKKMEDGIRATKKRRWEGNLETLDDEIEEYDVKDSDSDTDCKFIEDDLYFIHGITSTGHTVLVHLKGFVPYCYIAAFLSDKPHIPIIRNDHIKRICNSIAGKCNLRPEHVNGHIVFLKNTFEFTICDDGREDMNFPIEQPYLKMFFPTKDALRHATNILRKYPLNIPGLPYTKNSLIVEEALVDAEQRFYDDSGVQPETWLSLRSFSNVTTRIGLVDYELEANFSDISSTDTTTTAPLLVGAFDIETNSEDGGFPNASRPNDVPYVICVTFAWHGSVPPFSPHIKPGVTFLRLCISLKPSIPIPGVVIEHVKTESAALNRFSDWVYRLMDVDILMQFNGDRFDVPFLCERAKQRTGVGVAPILDTRRFFYTSRIADIKTEPQNKSLESKGMGESATCVIMSSHGRCSFDLLPWIRSNFKFSLYGLNAISYEMFKEGKHPIKPNDIFLTYRKGTPSDVSKIIAYCCQDCDLLHRICVEKSIFTQVIMFCRVMYTPMDKLVTSGQTLRVFNQIMHEAHTSGYVLNSLYSTKYVTDSSYGGGTVLDPEVGLYDDPVVVLDFSSLYPSIMIAHNLCYSTIIPKDVDEEVLSRCVERGLKIKTFECKNGTHRFVQNGHGLVGRVLRRLKEDRNAAKRVLETSKDPTVIDAMKKRESAIKVSMNSMYGATGANRGRMPCQPIAESVTFEGGCMLRKCKSIEEAVFGHKVLYGDTDSIMILCRGMSMSDAFEFGKIAAKRLSSEFIEPIKMEVDKIFLKVLFVKKKMYTGIVYASPQQYIQYRDGVVKIGDKNGPQHVTRGLKMSRRDNPPLLREICNDVITTMFSSGSEAATQVAKNGLVALVTYSIPIEKYIITMSTKRNYAVSHAAGPARCVAARFGIQPGERVPFIIVERRDPSRLVKTESKRSKDGTLGEYARHASEVILNKDRGKNKDKDVPDRMYYLDKQLLKALKTLFVGNLWIPLEKLFEDARFKIRSEREGLVSIGKFCVKKAEKTTMTDTKITTSDTKTIMPDTTSDVKRSSDKQNEFISKKIVQPSITKFLVKKPLK